MCLTGGVKVLISEVMDPVSQKTCAPTSRKGVEHSLSGMKGNFPFREPQEVPLGKGMRVLIDMLLAFCITLHQT